MTNTPFAIKLLVLGGVGNLVLAFVLGWLLSARRVREPIDPHRWLLARIMRERGRAVDAAAARGC